MNIGNPKEMSLEEMAQAVIQIPIEEPHRSPPLPTDDPKVRQLTRAARKVSREPRVGLASGQRR
jgi:hypothetical protein